MGIALTPASTQSSACVAIEDALARLDCYDRAAGRSRSAPPEQLSGPAAPPPPTPTAPPATTPAPAAASVPPVPAAAPASPESANAMPTPPFSSRIVAVEALRRGFHRMVLENGAAYETTELVAPLPVGTTVSLRRTLLGTNYMDSDGRGALTVRPSRRR